VAHVIRNRVAEGKRGKSPAEVCLWPRQFSSWNDAQRTKFPSFEDVSWGECCEAWRASLFTEDLTKGANHFYSGGSGLPWHGAELVFEAGGHKFFRL